MKVTTVYQADKVAKIMAENHNIITTPVCSVPSIREDANSLMISFFLCSIVVLLFFLINPDSMMHWFWIPLIVCGALAGVDAVDWIRNRVDFMDPVGWIGFFGLHFFFLAPLLIVLWDYQMPFLPSLNDWRPWLGYLSILNIVGLIIYRISRNWIKASQSKSSRRIRIIHPRLTTIVLYFGLIFSLALQLGVYARFGGLTGFMNAYDTAFVEHNFDGLGTIFAFSESFPFLLLIGLVIMIRNSTHARNRSWVMVTLLLLMFFLIRLIFFGGLRGSRSNTIFAVIWAVGVIHLWVRPISKRYFFGLVIAAAIFLYVMGFYKSLGSDFGRLLDNRVSLAQVERETGRTLQGMLIGDLSRADVQAYVLHNLTERWPDFPYALGRTYLAGYTIIIPSIIWPQKIPNKAVEGTQALLGPGSYIPGIRVTSRVYGLMGEAMLNFGAIFAPAMFISLGLLVGFVRRWLYSLHPEDALRLWVPFLTLFCVTYIVSDSDSNAASLALRALMPFIVIWLGTESILKSSSTNLDA